MTPRRIALASTAVAAALASPAPALAQSQPQAANVLQRACQGRGGQPLSEGNIAEALMIEAGIPPTSMVGDIPQESGGTSLRSAYEAALVERVRQIVAEHSAPPPRVRQVSPEERNRSSAVNGGVGNLRQYLRYRPREVTVGPGEDPRNLFSGQQSEVSIQCKPRDANRGWERTPAAPQRFAVRQTPEELSLLDDARRGAGAFELGFERTRSTLDEGTRRTVTSLSIDGTVGYRLASAASRNGHAFLFATYNLQRDRTRPRPALQPGQSESDGDTDALAVGVDAALTFGSEHTWDLNLQASTIFDFANDASRLRLRAILTPGIDEDIGLCKFNSFSDDRLFRRRCEISAEVQGAQVLRRGTTELGDYDAFVAAGGRASFEMFLPTGGGEDGFLASVRYRYLAVVHGAPDSIERLEARLAHRFWTSGGAGLDLGFTYTNGTNELSFEDEDVLTFGVGIIF